MTCRPVIDGASEWTLCSIDPAPRAGRLSAVVRARVVDEMTGRPPGGPMRLTTDAPLSPHAVSDGYVGLVGVPARTFPGLDATTVNVDLRVDVRGYLPRHETWTLGPFAAYPGEFVAIDGGVIELHRPGTVLRGRVVRRAGGSWVAVAGATIELTGYWPQEPTPMGPAAATVADVVALRAGCYRRRPVGATLRRRAVTVGGSAKRLVLPVAAGSVEVRLSNQIGLAVGDLVAIDWTDPDRGELVEMTAIDGASTADQPCTVTLAHPLAFEHRAGAGVSPAILGASGGVNQLDRVILEGDRSCFLDGLVGVSAPTVVELSSGVSPRPEYHWAQPYSTSADAEGYFRLPPLARCARVRLRVSDGASSKDEDLSPDYALAEHRVDLVLA